VSDHNNPFLLNVGFIVHQSVGYSRDFPFDFKQISLAPDTELSALNGNVRVTRTAQGLLVQGKLQAFLTAECGRCLMAFPQALEADFTDLYAFTHQSVTQSGMILPENGKINLAPIVRDELLVSIPINPVCREDCKGLCPVCGESLNETICAHEVDDTNPRLDKLRSLLE